MPDATSTARAVPWLASLALALAAASAQAGEVVVKGEDLPGTVVGVTADGVEFETVYGKGTIVVPWADVERLQSDKEFLVLYGEDQDAKGRIQGLEDGELLVGDDAASAVRIPTAAIFRSITREDYESNPLEAYRARYRYWTGSFDLAFAYTDATTDTLSFSTGLEIERKKKPSHLRLGAAYRYGTTRSPGQPKTTNEDRIFGHARYDHDLFDAVFAYGAVTAEYDDVQNLSIRTDPNAGIGWRFYETEPLTLAARTGVGYVYQRFFGGNTEDYFTVVFGGDLESELPYGAHFDAHVEYLPAVSDWTGNYLIRSSANLTAPIIGFLDFKLSVLDQYNNRPAPGTKHNSFTSTAGISLRF